MKSILTAILAAAACASLPSAGAQPPASATVEAPTAATPSAFSAPRIVPDGATGGNKSCIAANHKLLREQKALASAQDDVARYAKRQRGCTSKSVCARYVAALESLNKRIARHDLRITKFTAARDKACRT